MSWWDEQKAKRALKRALVQYQSDHSNWQRDVEIFKKIEEAFELAVKGEDSVPNNTVQKKGEIILWEGIGQLHETGRTPGRYVGSSQGFSVPLFAGIRYRVGAQRGTFIAGDEVQVPKENGQVLLTSERLLFNGQMNTKEWAFAKWNGAATNNDESDYIFHVSNREKTSGIEFGPKQGREFNRFLAQAINCAEEGVDVVLTSVRTQLKELAEDEPKAPSLASIESARVAKLEIEAPKN
ncbi:MAG: hypothetical protein RLZZ190_350 [Actinomycetota bacterium]|jgi:hypothetical protein